MRGWISAGVLIAAAMAATSASAGVYTDDLAKCLVKSSTEQDRVTLMRWFFVAMSSNPNVEPLTQITPDQRAASTKDGATLVERLVLDDCRPETLDALKYEGASTLEASFRVLGEVAARSLMTDPATAAEMQRVADYLDKGRWESLGVEAGIAQPKDK